MSSSDNLGSSRSLASIGRSILRFGRDKIRSVDVVDEPINEDSEVSSFRNSVSYKFDELASVNDDELLSLGWIRNLLNAFLGCQDGFRVLLNNKRAQLLEPPMNKIVGEYFKSSVKALDICNATREGIDRIRQWEKHVETIVSALDSRDGKGFVQFSRARKSLMDLAIFMLDEKESGAGFSHRTRSFGHHNTSKDHHRGRGGHSRSHSWSVSDSWSAAKQLQSVANSVVPPSGNEILATDGLASSLYVMSSVLLFVLWVLVAAIPCQDRGLQCHFSVPRQSSWGASLSSLHERIMDVSKEQERRNSNGLLKEIYQIERCRRHLGDLLDTSQCTLNDAQKFVIQQEVGALALVCRILKTGLDPLEQQVKEVFRKITNCRTEFLEHLP